MEHTIYVCAECPLCEESAVSDLFCCHHPAAVVHKSESLEVHDSPPDWCPIRAERLVLRIHGGT